MYYRYYHDPGDHQVQQHYGVRTDRYKANLLSPHQSVGALRFAKGSHELKNVYAETAYAATLKELTAELENLRKELGDSRPICGRRSKSLEAMPHIGHVRSQSSQQSQDDYDYQ